MSRLFEPFYTTKEKGVGIGFALAQRIVKSHKGSICLDSQKNKGATFNVDLPLAKVPVNNELPLS
jgi:two-component system sporulation sensor kinase A